MEAAEEVAASVHPGAPRITPSRRIAAESGGTAFLLMAVVGSGTMAERLACGNVALALLGNTLATGAVLMVLISIFGPLSGAHLNPAVTLYFALRREIRPRMAAAYVIAQIVGAVIGVYLAHAMFALPIFEISTKLRDGPGQWLGEFIATLRIARDDRRLDPFFAREHADAGGPLHHSGLLVHGIDIVCQSGGDDCALALRHFCRYCAGFCSRLYRGADRRCVGWLCRVRLVVRSGITTIAESIRLSARFGQDRLRRWQ